MLLLLECCHPQHLLWKGWETLFQLSWGRMANNTALHRPGLGRHFLTFGWGRQSNVQPVDPRSTQSISHLGFLSFLIFLGHISFSECFPFHNGSRHWSISSPSSDAGNAQASSSGRTQLLCGPASVSKGRAGLCFLICAQVSASTHATWIALDIWSISAPKKQQTPKANKKS